MPTQNRSVRGGKITEWLKMKVSQITLRWAGLKVQNGSKNLAIVHGRVRDDVKKKMRIKKNGKWRTTTTNEDQHHKNQIFSQEVLPSKYHHWDFLAFNLILIIILWLLIIICDSKMIIYDYFMIIDNYL